MYEPRGQTRGETTLIQATAELTHMLHSHVVYPQSWAVLMQPLRGVFLKLFTLCTISENIHLAKYQNFIQLPLYIYLLLHITRYNNLNLLIWGQLIFFSVDCHFFGQITEDIKC